MPILKFSSDTNAKKITILYMSTPKFISDKNISQEIEKAELHPLGCIRKL